MPLPDMLVDMLRPLSKGSGFVFVTCSGTPIDPRNFHRQFRVFAKRAELPDAVIFHCLRHSAASFMIAIGVHPRAVMEHLRHSQIGITMDIYSHLMDDEHRRETDKLADLFK